MKPAKKSQRQIVETDLSGIEAVCYLTDIRHLNVSRLEGWAGILGRVTVAAPGRRPPELDTHINWIWYGEDEQKVDIWNKRIMEAEKEWILFLEDDEWVDFSSLKLSQYSADSAWMPAIIRYREDDITRLCYQVRLVRNNGIGVYSGKNLPDASRYMADHGIHTAEDPFRIYRKSSLFTDVDPHDEMSIQSVSPQLYLIMGEQFVKKGDLVLAAAHYRKVQRSENLLSFDRLAAMNGIAGCMAEQLRWPKALSLAEESLEHESLQRLPYLIQFRIRQLKKEWEGAYDVLSGYHDTLNFDTKANFDKELGIEKTLKFLGDLASESKKNDRAFEHYEEFYREKRGEVDRSFVKKLFLLSVERANFEKSVYYFEKLFGSDLNQSLSEIRRVELNDALGLFKKRGWYNYVADVIEELVDIFPEDKDFRRQLIVALSKTDRLDRARTMISTS